MNGKQVWRFGVIGFTFVMACTTASNATVVWWSGDSGVPPWDDSIPPERRFVYGPPSYISFSGGLINFHDTGGGSSSGAVSKDDIGPVSTSWAFQIELRMNSHSRPNFDWGAETGIFDGAHRCFLIISRNAVGFEGFNGDSFVDGQSVSLDTTNGFHTYRVIKNGSLVQLFVDNLASPALAIP